MQRVCSGVRSVAHPARPSSNVSYCRVTDDRSCGAAWSSVNAARFVGGHNFPPDMPHPRTEPPFSIYRGGKTKPSDLEKLLRRVSRMALALSAKAFSVQR